MSEQHLKVLGKENDRNTEKKWTMSGFYAKVKKNCKGDFKKVPFLFNEVVFTEIESIILIVLQISVWNRMEG